MYGNQIRLLFTDTDSLMYEIETPDLEWDICRHRDLFDLLNYPSNHFLHDDTNKKVVLKFKNETAGNWFKWITVSSIADIWGGGGENNGSFVYENNRDLKIE